MRTIKLTHDEIEIIKSALQFVYGHKLEIVSQNIKILDEDVRKKIIETANKYLNAQEVFDGDRDV